MQELDKWSDAEIINPLLFAGAQSVEDESFDYEATSVNARAAIRARILQSYRNGQAAGRREGYRPARQQSPRGGYQPSPGPRSLRHQVRV